MDTYISIDICHAKSIFITPTEKKNENFYYLVKTNIKKTSYIRIT